MRAGPTNKNPHLDPTTGPKKHLKISLRFWLAGIVLSLINGLAKAIRLADRARTLAAPPRTGELSSEDERKAALNAVVGEEGCQAPVGDRFTRRVVACYWAWIGEC